MRRKFISIGLCALVAPFVALFGGLGQASIVTSATFDDSPVDSTSTTPLFAVDLDNNAITSGWLDS